MQMIFRGIKIMKYNERIREIREDRFLTQQKVADLLHVGQRTYADYESGNHRYGHKRFFSEMEMEKIFKTFL